MRSHFAPTDMFPTKTMAVLEMVMKALVAGYKGSGPAAYIPKTHLYRRGEGTPT